MVRKEGKEGGFGSGRPRAQAGCGEGGRSGARDIRSASRSTVSTFHTMLTIASLCHTVCIRSKGFEVGSLNLLKCSFLLFDVCTLYGTRSSVIRALLVQLPVLCLYIDGIGCHKSICDTFVHPANVVLGLPIQPPQWKDLQRIVFRGTLWFDENLFPGNPGDPRISFSEWSFRILVIELAFPQKVDDAIRALEVFSEPEAGEENGRFSQKYGEDRV